MKAPRKLSIPLPEPRRAGAARVSVELWPVCELAGAVDMLAVDSGKVSDEIREDVACVREARRALRPFRGHPAVSLQARLRAAGFDAVRRHGVLARLSLPGGRGGAIPHDTLGMLGGLEGVKRWLASLESFARDSGFWRGHAARAPRIERAARALARSMRETGHLARIEEYTGLPFRGRYAVVPVSFCKEGAQSNIVLFTPDGSYRIFSFLGPEEDVPELEFGRDEHSTYWHELAHGLLDTLVDLYRGPLLAAEERFEPIKDRCYGSWLQCVKEHVVRAVMIRLIARTFGEKRAARQLRSESRRAAFPWLGRMIRDLKRYEADRRRHPSLARFFEPLLKGLLGRPERALPAEGIDPLSWESWGFSGRGQMLRALRYLDLAGAESLRLKRAALLCLTGDSRSALAEIDGVLTRLRAGKDYARALRERVSGGRTPRA